MGEVLCERRGVVLWLTINRPALRNALNAEVLEQLTTAVRTARSDHTLRAIVLTGAGDKAFSAGGDLKSGGGRGDASQSNPFQAEIAHVDNPLVNFYQEVERCDLPIIARVNGHAMGGGLGLLACCDLAIAAEDALLATPEVKIGLFPMMIATYLIRLVPRRRLMAMVLTGDTLSAIEGVEYGLLNAAVPRAELDAKVASLLESLCARSPTAQRLGKHALRAVEEMTIEQSHEYMMLMISRMALTADAQEGMAAFSEKRAPQWTGD